jgi:hypothetical protein
MKKLYDFGMWISDFGMIGCEIRNPHSEIRNPLIFNPFGMVENQ